MTRHEPSLTPLEIRFHVALAAALRLRRESFTFRRLELGMDRLFSRGAGSDFYWEVDPKENVFFSVCLSFHLIEWESIGDTFWIRMSYGSAHRWLDDFCSGTWSEHGGVWDPESVKQIVGEIIALSDIKEL